tara:strand:+ start:47 stop:232 length:186 start_codon:yes stop_codon:yes gene_type:complete
MMKKYTFLVPCSFEYEIEAETKEQARKILQEQGGYDIQGEPVFSDDAYSKEAELFEESEVG